jgi:hypothetical protein
MIGVSALAVISYYRVEDPIVSCLVKRGHDFS